MTRPTRYTENNSTRDWIDEFCATSTPDEVRGAFRFTIGKYLRRYGKKDDHLQEAMKIQDYANRLVEYERSLVKPIIHELYSGGWTPEAVKDASFKGQALAGHEIASAWEEGEKRMEQIGPNGNDGLAYENEWIPSNGKKPELPDGTLVDVKFPYGDVAIGRSADLWAWTHDGDSYDITHYRIHQPE